MKPPNLEEIEAVWAKATRSPWIKGFSDFHITNADGRGVCSTGGYASNTEDPEKLYTESIANHAAIMAAPEQIRSLVAEVRRLRGALERQVAIIDDADEAGWDVDEVADLLKRVATQALGGD